MTRIELTIDVNYLAPISKDGGDTGWGLWEGLREIAQNGKDAETEYSAPLTVDWYNDTVRFCNEGCTLPHEALLLGYSSKREREDLAGKWGEGLKLGILALLRSGHEVKIRSGSEVWIPAIVDSEKFKAKVLAFDINGGRKDEKRVRVEVSGITKEEWEELKQRFLFLCPPKDKDIVRIPYEGDLLLGDKYQGRLYVKGIYVEFKPEMMFGYNFLGANTDRDRKMVEEWDLKYHAKSLLFGAASRRPDLMGLVQQTLEQEKPDFAGIDEYSAARVPAVIVDAAVKTFVERFGEGAIPVANVGESKDIEHFGKTGVVVPRPLKLILSQKLGSFETVKAKLANEAMTHYGWQDLTDAQRKSLEDGMFMVSLAVPSAAMTDVDVVDFHNQDLLGQFKGGRILLAKRILDDATETLRTLVHEYAHRAGGDGDKGHISAIEHIWGIIVQNLWTK